jgi:primosomal protein N' (replication factor Y)
MKIAKVEPLVTARALRGPFDYLIPEHVGDVGPGSIVRVPFGRQRPMLGVVVELASESDVPAEKLAEPLAVLEASVPPELVALGLWLAREWCSTPSRGLSLVLPPGTGRRGQKTKTRRELQAELTDAGVEAASGDGSLPGGGRKLGLRQRAALRALIPGPLTSPQLREEAGVEPAALRKLAERGLLRLEEVERRRRPPSESAGAKHGPVELNADQLAAVAEIDTEAKRGGEGPRELLLHGVTGSGKTEVYIAAARAALARGRGVIVLVPEIALTPQTVGRFRSRLGDQVAVLHSKLSAGARYDEWRRLRSGEARVCVGPRSAVFAPVADLGLVVIDEEHDSSYKQDQDPRYDARTVARRRAAEAGAVLVAGTATPRPESWLAMRRIELPERVDSLGLPPVELIDMRDGAAGPLHPRTIDALGAVAREGGKAILMLNRRGFSPHLACRSCGHGFECPNCDVSLVMHRRDGGVLMCHHCGHSEAMPKACPSCGSVSLARVGAGTERVADEVAKLLDPLPVFRLDSDSAATGERAHAAILGRFEEAPAGILVGTQMVAKGHDFPEVTLAVVVDADSTLRFPDFRAEERTFSLITQLAGRSGRGRKGGKVLVQTLSPGAPSISRAAHHDAAGFLAGELARREELRYPPFSLLIEIGLSSPDDPALEFAAERVRDAVAAAVPSGVDVLGPAPQFRLRGRHRRRLLLKATPGRDEEVVDAVRGAVEGVAAARELKDVAISVDVDPQ